MSPIIIYGISNCDTIKKTLLWFKENNISADFVDYKKHEISAEKISQWISLSGLDLILNKRSKTWNLLDQDEKERAASTDFAIKLMIKNSSLIKRPVIEYKNDLVVGYNESTFNKIFLKK